MAPKIMLTGSKGFIGTNLCRSIDNIAEYDVKINRDMTVLNYSRILEFMDEYKPNIIIHLAANPNALLSVKDPVFDLQLNVEGTINILHAAVEKKIEYVVMASTAYVYGDPVQLPMSEEHPLNPKAPYGISKMAAEQYAMFFNKKYDLPLSILRFFTIYGPYQAKGFVVPDFMERISQIPGNSGTLELRGSPDDSRDFLWIGDLINAVNRVLEVRPNGEIINLGGKDEVKISRLAQLLGELMGKKLDLKYANIETNKPSRLLSDWSKAKKLLGWEPATDLRKGLETILKSTGSGDR